MKRYCILLLITGWASFTSMYAQNRVAFQRINYSANSGIHNGSNTHSREGLAGSSTSKSEESYRLAYQTTIAQSGANALRLFFGDCFLGEKSYLTITSVKDGSLQRLDAQSLNDWNNSSGYFNGETVIIKLYVHVEDKGVYMKIDQVLVGRKQISLPNTQGNPSGNDPTQESICGTDNRVATTDRAVGRLTTGTNSDCSVYISANGSLLTAGHCRALIVGGFDVVEFDIPLSNSDGTLNFANINSQYPINTGSVQFENAGVGNDWCVFNCNNGNAGLPPAWGQQSFFRLANDFNPATVRITGCGIDAGTANQTLQTHSGALTSENVVTANNVNLRYTVDTEPANSGSPVIWNGTRFVLGVHTHGGCTSTGGSNAGTSFEADDVEIAINTRPSGQTVHVDRHHSSPLQSGSIMRPFRTVGAAIASAPANALLSIATGGYQETVTLVNVILQAPVGTVVIGPDAPLSSSASNVPDNIPLPVEVAVEARPLPTANNHSYAFPNPFVTTLTIQYEVAEKDLVDLIVYDVNGKVVAHPISWQVQEAGHYQAKVGGSQLSAGLYLYELRIGTKKYQGKVMKQGQLN